MMPLWSQDRRGILSSRYSLPRHWPTTRRSLDVEVLLIEDGQDQGWPSFLVQRRRGRNDPTGFRIDLLIEPCILPTVLRSGRLFRDEQLCHVVPSRLSIKCAIKRGRVCPRRFIHIRVFTIWCRGDPLVVAHVLGAHTLRADVGVKRRGWKADKVPLERRKIRIGRD